MINKVYKPHVKRVLCSADIFSLSNFPYSNNLAGMDIMCYDGGRAQDTGIHSISFAQCVPPNQ